MRRRRSGRSGTLASACTAGSPAAAAAELAIIARTDSGSSWSRLVLTTATGLAFVGDVDRYFRALDVGTGEVLWETRPRPVRSRVPDLVRRGRQAVRRGPDRRRHLPRPERGAQPGHLPARVRERALRLRPPGPGVGAVERRALLQAWLGTTRRRPATMGGESAPWNGADGCPGPHRPAPSRGTSRGDAPMPRQSNGGHTTGPCSDP